MKRPPSMSDVYQPAPNRGGEGLRKFKTLARLLDLGGEWEDRLRACQDETRVPARALVCNAIRAAVEVIESGGYRVMLPMQFAWRSMPAQDGLPPVNPDLLEIEPGMPTTFIRAGKTKRNGRNSQ